MYVTTTEGTERFTELTLRTLEEKPLSCAVAGNTW